MNVLEQLENCAGRLIDCQANLKKENSRLQAEISDLAQKCAVLADENESMLAMLAQERNLRADALRRLKLLLQKIREHDGIG